MLRFPGTLGTCYVGVTLCILTMTTAASCALLPLKKHWSIFFSNALLWWPVGNLEYHWHNLDRSWLQACTSVSWEGSLWWTYVHGDCHHCCLGYLEGEKQHVFQRGLCPSHGSWLTRFKGDMSMTVHKTKQSLHPCITSFANSLLGLVSYLSTFTSLPIVTLQNFAPPPPTPSVHMSL